MKKLLVLFVIASLTAMANGVMCLNISVGGDTTVEEISVTVGDSLVLDINNTGDFTQPAEAIYFGLVCNPAYGAITQGSGAVTGLAPIASSFFNDPNDWPVLAGIYGAPGVYGFIGSWSSGTFAGGKYFDEIDFHCVAAGDVTILLISSGEDMGGYTVLDSMLVHQVPVPEPATIALLCLGGLLLRKK